MQLRWFGIKAMTSQGQGSNINHFVHHIALISRLDKAKLPVGVLRHRHDNMLNGSTRITGIGISYVHYVPRCAAGGD
jgi:hypothetical protein